MKPYNKKQYDSDITIIYGRKHQGYFYHKLNYYIKVYKKELESLKYVNDYKEENYPIRYYMDKGAIEILEQLLEDLKEDEKGYI